MTDADLIARAAGGDRAAFGELYGRHWKAVYRYSWLLARSVQDAEDVTQECFLSLIRLSSSFDPSRAQLRTWLLAVARNQIRQRQRISSRVAEDEDVPSHEESIERELMRRDRAEAVTAAFELLPNLQKETLFLFEFEGLSLAETAEVLQIDPNAVKARLFRARQQLRRLLEPQRSALSSEERGTSNG